ncbi:MAG: AAA family ATPase [Candidatus Thorarchaeota archaeon]|jgi:uridine kinase
MIGDRLLFLESHQKNAQEIFNKLQLDKRQIILIGGCSGTGKSEASDLLQELLFQNKKHSLVISLDDFYIVHPTVRNYNRKKQGLDSVGLSEIDWERLQRVCEDFQNQKEIHFKRVHKYCDVVEHNVIDTDAIDYLIIEGLYSNYLKKFDYGDLSVYLDGNPEQTFKFRKQRRKENEDEEFRKQVVRKEFNIICQLKKWADFIIEYKESNE